MTDLTLDREQVEIRVPSMLSKGILILLMAVFLIGSISLLRWAVSNRLSSIETAESSQITMAVRERQLVCLAKNIYHEAGSEPFEGKVAVAQVTMNRVESGLFPDDVCKTIFQKNVIYEKVICQFSWVCDRAIVDSKVTNHPNYKESMEVAKKVLLEGFRLPSLKDAMYYHADYVNPGWRKEKITKIGRHIFYKQQGT
jgi:spore germination cell wall hydrolase CwlJ-like protein